MSQLKHYSATLVKQTPTSRICSWMLSHLRFQANLLFCQHIYALSTRNYTPGKIFLCMREHRHCSIGIHSQWTLTFVPSPSRNTARALIDPIGSPQKFNFPATTEPNLVSLAFISRYHTSRLITLCLHSLSLSIILWFHSFENLWRMFVDSAANFSRFFVCQARHSPLFVLWKFSALNDEWWMWFVEVVGMMQIIWRTKQIMKIPSWCGDIFISLHPHRRLFWSRARLSLCFSVVMWLSMQIERWMGVVNDNQTAVYRIISGLDQLK